jgi:hypothetical protein
MIKALTENLIIFPVEEMSGDLLFKEIYSQIKSIINPITPPNYYVQQATVELLKERNIVVPKSCLSAKKPLDVTLYGQPKQKSKKELESLKRAKKAHRVAPKKRAKTTVQSRYSPD